MLTEKLFGVDDFVLNVAEAETAGLPLLLLPGITLQGDSFMPLIPALLQDWHVCACDLRGQGKSSRAARYHMDDYVDDVAMVSNHYEKEPVVLVGHSLGGMIALCAAAHLPQRIRALVLLDPAFIISTGKAIDNPAYPWCQWVHDTLVAATSFEDIVKSVRKKWPDADELGVSGIAQMVFRIDPEVINMWLRDGMMEGIDLKQVLQKIKCPTLIFRAGLVHDSPMRDVDVALTQRYLDGVTIFEVPNASHMLHEEQPDLVIERIKRFMEAHKVHN